MKGGKEKMSNVREEKFRFIILVHTVCASLSRTRHSSLIGSLQKGCGGGGGGGGGWGYGAPP